MKPTNYLRYTMRDTYDGNGEVRQYMLEQWWERERDDQIPTAPGEWRDVNVAEYFHRDAPPKGWTPSCQ